MYVCIQTQTKQEKEKEKEKEKWPFSMAIRGYGEKCHSSSLQLACRTPKHSSIAIISLHACSRIESVRRPECLVTRTQLLPTIYALAALASSIPRAMRPSSLHTCNISGVCSLRSTSRYPCSRVRAIRGWSDMYQPIGYVLWHNKNQHKAIPTLQTMSQWSVRTSHTSIRPGRRGHCCTARPI